MNYINPKAKLFHHLDRLDALFKYQVDAPVNIEFDLSNRCSLGCEWCHFAYTHTRGLHAEKHEADPGKISGGDLMDRMLAFDIITQLESCGVRSITWTGGGEPTLHPFFNNIIDFVNIDQGIYTNGTCITKARAELLKRKMKWVYISLDAATREAYHYHKGVNKFDDVCLGVADLVRAKGKATIGLGFLINKDNWKQIRSMIDLGNDLGVDYIQFRPTIIYDQEHPAHRAENTSWMSDAIKLMESNQYDRKLIVDLERFRDYQNWTAHNYEICWWSGIQTVITPNGKVWTCVNKREYTGALLGDLTTESFSNVWKRRRIAHVDADCRIMCRGYPANRILNEIMAPNDHANFI